jgi:hypothetical protein
VVDEVEGCEQVERLLDRQIEPGRAVAEVLHLRRGGLGERGRDAALEVSLALVEVGEARESEALGLDRIGRGAARPACRYP